MAINRKSFEHFEFAKIKNDERWRFYIDVKRQKTDEGIKLGADLFDVDEPGYRSAMESAEELLNGTLDVELSPKLIVSLHDHAVKNVQKKEFDGNFSPFAEEKSVGKFKDSITGGFGISSVNCSHKGIIEFLNKIVANKIDYASRKKGFTLAISGPDENIPDPSYRDPDAPLYRDLLVEKLDTYPDIDVDDSEITKLELKIKILEDDFIAAQAEQDKISDEIDDNQEDKKKIKNEYTGKIAHDYRQTDEYQRLRMVAKQLKEKYFGMNKKKHDIDRQIGELKTEKEYISRSLVTIKLGKLIEQKRLADFAESILKGDSISPGILNIDRQIHFLPPKRSHEEHTKIIQDYIAEYQASLKKATTEDEKLSTIINFIQSLEQLHPFSDGNCRTLIMLLLNRELILNGFPRVMLTDPNRFDLYSVEELKKEIKEGWENAKNFESTIAQLPAFRELYKIAYSAYSTSNNSGSMFSHNKALFASLLNCLNDIKEHESNKDYCLVQIDAIKNHQFNNTKITEFLNQLTNEIKMQNKNDKKTELKL